MVCQRQAGLIRSDLFPLLPHFGGSSGALWLAPQFSYGAFGLTSADEPVATFGKTSRL